ncbi:translation initiation factor IF-2-like isoform X3 [Canis lupus familiaris]|uniref:translation initiation factor IF-2-like isoform X3 n=1 Tax=Canis lupus familiaris TaxID=9615 RepID=UPI0018F67267|nr:translation initiation factor IF-2-like isoform X3 [Canis lupus familiaris]
MRDPVCPDHVPSVAAAPRSPRAHPAPRARTRTPAAGRAPPPAPSCALEPTGPPGGGALIPRVSGPATRGQGPDEVGKLTGGRGRAVVRTPGILIGRGTSGHRHSCPREQPLETSSRSHQPGRGRGQATAFEGLSPWAPGPGAHLCSSPLPAGGPWGRRPRVAHEGPAPGPRHCPAACLPARTLHSQPGQDKVHPLLGRSPPSAPWAPGPGWGEPEQPPPRCCGPSARTRRRPQPRGCRPTHYQRAPGAGHPDMRKARCPLPRAHPATRGSRPTEPQAGFLSGFPVGVPRARAAKGQLRGRSALSSL